ncbi:MAG: response regulator [Ignavibacteriales bacterium]|nr:response regulator [Ignavibacteriales bacterium]
MAERDRILVVEEDPDFLEVMERSLAKHGYDVRTAPNGVEALDVAEAFKPMVVVADWMMPQMDGVELCDALKKRDELKTVYFILLTARSSLRDRVTGLDHGADDFLVKPVEHQELLARIRSGIRVHNLQRELRRAEHGKAVGELAATLGHQINNPLGALALTLQNLEEELKQRAEGNYQEDFEVVNESIERIKEIVEKLKRLDDPEVIDYSSDRRMLKF